MGNISGFNKYIGTPVHGHHKLRDEPGQARAGTVRQGLERFYTMYKVGMMPAVPASHGDWRERATGAPASASPAAAMSGRGSPGITAMPRHGAQAGRLATSTLPCSSVPPNLCGSDGWQGPPRSHLASLLSLLRAVVTAQRLHASALASWTFSRTSEGASGAASGESGAE